MKNHEPSFEISRGNETLRELQGRIAHCEKMQTQHLVQQKAAAFGKWRRWSAAVTEFGISHYLILVPTGGAPLLYFVSVSDDKVIMRGPHDRLG